MQRKISCSCRVLERLFVATRWLINLLAYGRLWPMAEMAARPEDFRIEPYRVDVRQAFRDRPNLGLDRP